MKDHFGRLVSIYEKPGSGPENYSIPHEMIEQYIGEVVGFRIQCRTIETTFKLSQDKSDVSQASVAKNLRDARPASGTRLADLIDEHKRRS